MSAITITDLVYEVPNKRILNNINLRIETGELVSIMGQSGSGKTTLLKLMTGLLRPTSGQIRIDDVNIATLSESELDKMRLKLGLVFQYSALLDSLTVYDNIVFGVVRHPEMRRAHSRKDLDALVKKLLDQVELPGIENLYPAELSGGMQKRVALARALATEPSIVYYDEPTSGLDPISAHTIDQLIMDTREKTGVTSVVVSHHLPSIFKISDRIAMLHHGEIVIYGTPGEVRASSDSIVQNFIAPERDLIVAR